MHFLIFIGIYQGVERILNCQKHLKIHNVSEFHFKQLICLFLYLMVLY